LGSQLSHAGNTFTLLFLLQLGHYAGFEDVFGVECPIPEEIKKLHDQKIVHLSVGYWHNLAVTGNFFMFLVITKDSGSLYGWGTGYNGQLGLDNTYNHTDPQWIIKLKEKAITKASCGALHSAAVTEDGEVLDFFGNTNFLVVFLG
jgi:hypothetical protein